MDESSADSICVSLMDIARALEEQNKLLKSIDATFQALSNHIQLRD
jgi:hypothetical protein